MFRPFMFIGLGGSGGKTLRFVKRELQNWLEDNAPDQEFPDAWKFLHIDSPTIQDGEELTPFVDMLDQDEYLGLVGKDVNFTAIARGLDAIPDMQHELIGWRIDPASMEVPIGIGAGQYRAVGRTIAMLHAQRIRQNLRRCYDEINQPRAKRGLEELYTKVVGGPLGENSDPIVIVVSSLAGGTGAGLLMTVFDLLRSVGKGETVGVLYTPEVFGAVGGADGTGGVYANSLAAISEILNGHWFHGGAELGTRHPADISNAGADARLTRSGPSYPFLVGMRNAEGTSFSSSKDLFEMVGASLCAWATDSGIQSQLVSYTLGNWDASAVDAVPNVDVLVNQGSPEEWGPPAINALGMSRVSIGQRYFLEYAAKRLARDASAYLTRAHVDSDLAQQVMKMEGETQPTEIARILGRKQLAGFLRQTGLSEKGRDDNQILESLTPVDAKTLEQRFHEQITELLSGVDEDTQEGWRLRLNDAVKSSTGDFLNTYLSDVKDRVITWCETKPDEVLGVVADEIAAVGLRVTAAEIQHLIDYFGAPGGVIDELRDEVLEFEHAGSDAVIRSTIDEDTQRLSTRGKISSSHPDLLSAVEGAVFQVGNRADAIVREQAVGLLESFVSDFLKPLMSTLQSAAQAADGSAEVARNWPEWDSKAMPPKFMEPPASEVTLIEPEEYARLFDDLLSADLPDFDTDTKRRFEVRSQITTGHFMFGPDAPEFNKQEVPIPITTEREWWPGTGVIPSQTKTATTAIFSINMSPTDLEARANLWMSRPNRQFTKLRRESLRSYLQADTTFGAQQETREVYRQRQLDFIPKLNQALDSSAPLVGIDNTIVSAMQVTPKVSRIVTQIPFANMTEFAERVEQALSAAGVSDTNMTTNSDIHDISISSTFSNPLYPIAVSSLVKPISEDWATSRTNVGANAFWHRRRARRLDEFVPAPMEVLHAMVRGWFTGLMLGIIDVNVATGGVSIGRENRSAAEFPNPRLDKSPENRDYLPIILESLALAYIDVSARGDLSSLDAYCALRDLGRSGDAVYRYGEGDKVNQWLHTWIQDGVLPPSVQISQVRISNSEDLSSAETRKSAVQKTLHSITSGHQDDLDKLRLKWSADPYTLGQTPLWPGIHPVISEAASTLYDAVGRLRTDGGGWF